MKLSTTLTLAAIFGSLTLTGCFGLSLRPLLPTPDVAPCDKGGLDEVVASKLTDLLLLLSSKPKQLCTLPSPIITDLLTKLSCSKSLLKSVPKTVLRDFVVSIGQKDLSLLTSLPGAVLNPLVETATAGAHFRPGLSNLPAKFSLLHLLFNKPALPGLPCVGGDVFTAKPLPSPSLPAVPPPSLPAVPSPSLPAVPSPSLPAVPLPSLPCPPSKPAFPLGTLFSSFSKISLPSVPCGPAKPVAPCVPVTKPNVIPACTEPPTPLLPPDSPPTPPPVSSALPPVAPVLPPIPPVLPPIPPVLPPTPPVLPPIPPALPPVAPALPPVAPALPPVAPALPPVAPALPPVPPPVLPPIPPVLPPVVPELPPIPPVLPPVVPELPSAPPALPPTELPPSTPPVVTDASPPTTPPITELQPTTPAGDVTTDPTVYNPPPYNRPTGLIKKIVNKKLEAINHVKKVLCDGKNTPEKIGSSCELVDNTSILNKKPIKHVSPKDPNSKVFILLPVPTIKKIPSPPVFDFIKPDPDLIKNKINEVLYQIKKPILDKKAEIKKKPFLTTDCQVPCP